MRKNTFSAFHILDNLVVPLFPYLLPRVCLLAAFQRAQEDPSMTSLTLVVTLGEVKIYSGPFVVNFAQQLQTRTLFEMGGLPIPSPGKLLFSLGRDADAAVAEPLASWSLLIDRLNHPGTEQLPFPPRAN